MYLMKKIIIILSSIIMAPSFLMSATQITFGETQKNKVSFPHATKSSKNNVKRFNKSLGFSNHISLHKRKKIKLKSGEIISRYIQKYNNIPIIGSEIIISSKSHKNFKNVFGSALYGVEKDILNTQSNITNIDAMQIAKNNFSIQFSLTNTSMGKLKRSSSILKIWQNKKGLAVLVYDVSFFHQSTEPSFPHYLIDAKTGDILQKYDGLMHKNAKATGVGGNEKVGRYTFGSNGIDLLYVIENGNTCTLENPHVLTIDAKNSLDEISPINPFSFTCYENTYKSVNGAYSPLNDAHYFAGKTFRMYSDWFGFSPLNSKIITQVHVGDNYANAYWEDGRVYVGDGDEELYPFTTMNIMAHEISHGFTEQHSNLIYVGQSGGLNEAFSDMAGEALEYFLTGTTDWKIGKNVDKYGDGYRSMRNPSSFQSNIDHQNDYSEGLDVHYTSGVYNKAFYLLATTSGWNTKKAFEVYVKANMAYWTAGINWNSAATGVLHATCDLGYSFNDVRQSLLAVGVVSPMTSCSWIPPETEDIIPININQTLTGEWTSNSLRSEHGNSNAYAVYYTFTLEKKTRVSINVQSDLDKNIFLLDGDDMIEEGSDIAKVLMPGTYTIEVVALPKGYRGNFTISLKDLRTLSLNETVNGTLTNTSLISTDKPNSYAQQYIVSVSKNTWVTIDLKSDDIDTYLNLSMNELDTLATWLAGNDNTINGGTNSKIEILLEPNIEYIIEATTALAHKKGSYELSLYKTQPSSLKPLLFHQNVSARWRTNSPYTNHYQFSLTKDTEVIFDILNTSKNTFAYLYRPNTSEWNLIMFNLYYEAMQDISSRTYLLNKGEWRLVVGIYPGEEIPGNYNIVLHADIEIPTAPTQVRTSSISYSSATLQWKDTTDDEVGYKIYQGGKLIATVKANVTSYEVTGLNADTDYTFSVRAYNSAGESSIANISFKTFSLAWLVPMLHINLF